MENNDEEEKMEKFFALIRSMREVRECVAGKVDRVKKKANEEEEEEEKLKAPAVAAGWFPTFQPEDFMADFRPKAKAAAAHATEPGCPSTTTTTTAGAATDNGNKEDKREGDDNLDLKLSL